MKTSITLFILSVLLIANACKKDHQPEKPVVEPEKVISEVTAVLETRDSLSVFAEAFKHVELSAEEVDEGITIFAPVNTAVTAAAVAIAGKHKGVSVSDASGTLLNAGSIKDHVVKGIYRAEDLKDGQELTTLSGKKLKVWVKDGSVWVNGVLITGKDVAVGTADVVHTVQQVLTNTTPLEPAALEVTAWNTYKWSAGRPDGEPEPGVTVRLYKSHKAYTLNIPAYSAVTDGTGIARFSNVIAGTYFITASKEDMSNIFERAGAPSDSVFTGMEAVGVVQSDAELTGLYAGIGLRPGDFKMRDVNGDGKLSFDDRVPLPVDNTAALEGATVRQKVLIGYTVNSVMKPLAPDILYNTVIGSYNRINTWENNLAALDVMLSDDVSCDVYQSWCSFDNFTFTPSASLFRGIWDDAYSDIKQLNRVIRDAGMQTFDGNRALAAEAKALRAFYYLKLTTYFGAIPYFTGISFPADAVRTPAASVLDLLAGDLNAAIADLPPAQYGGDDRRITVSAIRMMLAEIYLRKKDYQKAAGETTAIINSGYFTLRSESSVFESGVNPEVIWTVALGPDNFSYYFSRFCKKGSFAPVYRFTQTYLMQAEAQLGLGRMTEAMTSLNTVKAKLGEPFVNAASAAAADSLLKGTWQKVLVKEGSRFANLVRWNQAQSVLGPKGFHAFNSLLPVPQYYIEQYPGISQNEGY